MDKVVEFAKNEVVFVNGATWKKVPGYACLYASEFGNLAQLNSIGFLVPATTIEWKTTKGTYLYAKVVNDEFLPVNKAVHQLVCKAFNGESPLDGLKYEPNHKNGDKHDNRPENLEWVTHSANIQHAFDSGVCSAGIRIDVLDLLTKEITSYHSLSKMAREWCLSRIRIRNLLAEYRNTPYMGRYVFSIDDSSDKKLNRHQKTDVAFKNYETDEIFIVGSYQEAADLTGVRHGTIASKLNENNSRVDRYSLTSCYVFKKPTDKTPWPEYSKKEIIRSKERYAKLTTRSLEKISRVLEFIK